MSGVDSGLCQDSVATMRQRNLTELCPGSAGGRALAERRGIEYLRQLGSRGGRTTRQRYGVEHLRQLGSRGGREKQRRILTWPMTVTSLYGDVERRVPYWPRRSTARRKRPVFVRIEVQA
jgi:hypothetical protein